MSAHILGPKYRLLAPEVVQTSAMDCGPASLKCLLEGFGVSASYGRLREACQTDVDGTSIDTMEEVALQLGLEAEQIMIPADHLLLPEAQALPAIVVVRRPNGLTHFVVVWRRCAHLVQVMDPATGRRWLSIQRLLADLYLHTLPVPSGAWRQWAGSDEFLNPLRRRLTDLGLKGPVQDQMVDAALADLGWQPLAALDAATRMTEAVVRSGGLRGDRQTAPVLEAFFQGARQETAGEPQTIPAHYWSVQPAPPDPEGTEQLLLRGAVLVRVRGRRSASQPSPSDDSSASLSPELMAALEEPPSRPGRELLHLLRADGLLAPTALLLALFLAAGGVIIEALLFRGLLDLGQTLGLVGQRLGAAGALLVFVLALLLLEWPIVAGGLRFGRRLEARLRIVFLEKIPRLGDRYFQSRPTSDMAERSHSLHRLRLLPDQGRRLIQSSFELILTAAGIAWLAPASAPIAILAAALTLGLSLGVQSPLAERDLRVRTHTGALSRFYLDALLGLVAVRTHGAERAMRREHESLLVDWARASLNLVRAVVVVEGAQFLIGFGLAAWLLFDYLARTQQAGGMLLLVYWALNLPVLGQEIVMLVRQYPTYRNITLRLLEPLGAPEEEDNNPENGQGATRDIEAEAMTSTGAVAITMSGVSVRAAGHTILSEIDLTIKPGSHVAIVGPSGAGKSSLVGLLLGWHRPATGQVLVDGAALDNPHLEQLRRETAWIDPAVQLWNRSFLENLRYGAPADSHLPVGWAIEQAHLRRVLEALPDGLQTPLGEGGGLVSGGEGQRVRLARAMLRPGVRLVILDEPFRGLDRESRRNLLARARNVWQGATLLCVTHDVRQTQIFERVLIIENGRIVEDGTPAGLACRPDSRYRSLLEAEEAVHEGLWSSGIWRRVRLENGRLLDGDVRRSG